MLNIFVQWLKGRLHVRPSQLKGTPGISDPVAAANHVNITAGAALDAAAPAGLNAIQNALKLHPDQLKGVPGIDDHEAAAGAINAIVQAKLGD